MAALSNRDRDRRERDLWLASIQARAEQLQKAAEQLVDQIRAERTSREERTDDDD